MVHVKNFKCLTKHLDLISSQRFLFGSVSFAFPLHLNSIFTLHLLDSGDAHYLRAELALSFLIDLKTHTISIIKMKSQLSQDNERTQQQIKPGQAYPEDGHEVFVQMKLDLPFCILAVMLKLIPIICFFTATKIRILGFTLVLIGAAVDFWLFKNVIGKKLVSMMWWMHINLENGEEEWMFLSSEGTLPHNVNEAIFWGCTLGGNLFWGLTGLLSLLLSSLFWIVLCLTCLVLNAINFVFFMRCRGSHRSKIKNFADKYGFASAHSLVDYI